MIPDKAKHFESELLKTFENFEINTPLRQAHFLAQVMHECTDFTRLEENLNYSAKGLVKTFGKYFPDIESATPYAHKPEKIANKVYANRYGNGDENSGDGYLFRGRGFMQLTFRANYKAFGDYINEDIGSNPDIVKNIEYLIESFKVVPILTSPLNEGDAKGAFNASKESASCIE